MTVALEQADAERMFKVGDDLRYDGPGNGQLLRGFSQAFALHDSEKNMEVAQSDAPTDALGPIHRNLVR